MILSRAARPGHHRTWGPSTLPSPLPPPCARRMWRPRTARPRHARVRTGRRAHGHERRCVGLLQRRVGRWGLYFEGAGDQTAQPRLSAARAPPVLLHLPPLPLSPSTAPDADAASAPAAAAARAPGRPALPAQCRVRHPASALPRRHSLALSPYSFAPSTRPCVVPEPLPMPRQPQLQPPRRRRRSCRRFQVAPAPRRAALDSGCDGAARRMGVSQSRIITLITGHRYAVAIKEL